MEFKVKYTHVAVSGAGKLRSCRINDPVGCIGPACTAVFTAVGDAVGVEIQDIRIGAGEIELPDIPEPERQSRSSVIHRVPCRPCLPDVERRFIGRAVMFPLAAFPALCAAGDAVPVFAAVAGLPDAVRNPRVEDGRIDGVCVARINPHRMEIRQDDSQSLFRQFAVLLVTLVVLVRLAPFPVKRCGVFVIIQDHIFIKAAVFRLFHEFMPDHFCADEPVGIRGQAVFEIRQSVERRSRQPEISRDFPPCPVEPVTAPDTAFTNDFPVTLSVRGFKRGDQNQPA